MPESRLGAARTPRWRRRGVAVEHGVVGFGLLGSYRQAQPVQTTERIKAGWGSVWNTDSWVSECGFNTFILAQEPHTHTNLPVDVRLQLPTANCEEPD